MDAQRRIVRQAHAGRDGTSVRHKKRREEKGRKEERSREKNSVRNSGRTSPGSGSHTSSMVGKTDVCKGKVARKGHKENLCVTGCLVCDELDSSGQRGGGGGGGYGDAHPRREVAA